MSKTTVLIENAIGHTVENMGYRIVDVELGKESGNEVLTVTITKPDGIGLDDCEAVSRAIDPIIDELNPISDAYYLCVSSPGIDRPLKRPSDYVVAIGKRVEIKLFRAINGKKKWVGVLTGFDEDTDTMTLLTDDESEYTFTRKDTSRVKPVGTL